VTDLIHRLLDAFVFTNQGSTHNCLREGEVKLSLSPEEGFNSRGGETKYLFNPWKVVSQSSFQHKSAPFFFKNWKKGLHLSIDRLMN